MPDRPAQTEIPPRRALTLDVEKYQRMLDAPDVDATQREEMIKSLWSIIVSFVDLGFDVKPAQKPCGKDVKSLDLPPLEADNLLHCSTDLPDQFAHSAALQKGTRHD